MSDVPPAYELHTVAHLMRPWGVPVRDLEGLRAGLATAPDEVLFRHAVQFPLRDPSADELVPDDLSAWVGGVLRDAEMAERISFAVHTHNVSSAALREALVAVLESIPPRRREERQVADGSEFVFLAAESVQFPIGAAAGTPPDAIEALMAADPGAWFLELTEQPWRLGRTPLQDWLLASGEQRGAAWLVEAAGSGLPIEKARARFARRWNQSQIARRLALAAAAPEDERREAGRQAVASLLRRRSRAGGAT